MATVFRLPLECEVARRAEAGERRKQTYTWLVFECGQAKLIIDNGIPVAGHRCLAQHQLRMLPRGDC